MSTVSAGIVLRFAELAQDEKEQASLLTRVGLRPDLDRTAAMEQRVDAEAYSLDYELDDQGRFVLLGRPHHRRGACLANEGALAAGTSLMRHVTRLPSGCWRAVRSSPTQQRGRSRRTWR